MKRSHLLLTLICSVAMLGSSSLFAASEEEARDLFASRGESAENALKAANMYNELRKEGSRSKIQNAELALSQAEALYYYAETRPKAEDDVAIDYHEKGYELAETLVGTFKEAGEAYNSNQASALYWFGAHKGQWGLRIGIPKAVTQWPSIREKLEEALTLDDSVQSYGTYRVLARANYVIPGLLGGDFDKAKEQIAAAYNPTVVTITDSDEEEYELSSHITTNMFYLDILRKDDQEDRFCELYYSLEALNEFSDEQLREFNPNLVPETKTNLNKLLNEDYDPSKSEKELKKTRKYARDC